mgnify:CR=1 FL=1
MDADMLYKEYLSGSTDALEKLVLMYGDKLVMYINGYICDIHESEDILIDVFAYLVDKRPNIKIGFASYIYKAARNYALMFLRKKKHHIFLTEADADFSVENTLEFSAAKNERNEKLYKCMDMLSPPQKEALYLVYIEGSSYKEAADVMKKTVKQIDKLLQLGKKNLKPLLLKEGITDVFC